MTVSLRHGRAPRAPRGPSRPPRWLAVVLAFLALLFVAAPAQAVGTDTVRIHFHRESNDYAGWGLHVWGVGVEIPRGLSWDHPMDPAGIDAFGIYFDVQVQAQVPSFNFIVHRGENKSFSHDLDVDICKDGREVWLVDGQDAVTAKRPEVDHPFAIGVESEQRQRRTLEWIGAGVLAGVLLVAAIWRVARRRLARSQAQLDAHAQLLLQAQEQLRSQGERMQHGAAADELTGLPTRTGLAQALDQALARAARRHGSLAVLFVDLDGFKQVNDSAGHDAGDDVLRTVASRLKGVLRDGDLVARVGGDEFVVLVESAATPMQAWKVGAKLVRAAAQPIERGGTTHQVGASVGIALYPSDGTDAASLMKAADGAMYDTKRAGRNACRFARPERQAELERQLAAQARVAAALEHGALTLVSTPIVEVATGRVVGAQASAHGSDDGRLVDVAPVLEGADDPRLAARLDRWLLTAACRAAARAHLASPDRPPFVAVAIATSFADADADTLPALVRDLLAEEGLPPQRLLLLFPASQLSDPGRPLDVMARLRGQGVRIGFSGASEFELGLQRLTAAPIDLLQVDAASESHARLGTAYMRALAALGAQCGFVTAATNVRTPAQRRWAVAAGCSWGSGDACVEADEAVAP
jgi:diguanylate cyclase (GGDEF)-like protein